MYIYIYIYIYLYIHTYVSLFSARGLARTCAPGFPAQTDTGWHVGEIPLRDLAR